MGQCLKKKKIIESSCPVCNIQSLISPSPSRFSNLTNNHYLPGLKIIYSDAANSTNETLFLSQHTNDVIAPCRLPTTNLSVSQMILIQRLPKLSDVLTNLLLTSPVVPLSLQATQTITLQLKCSYIFYADAAKLARFNYGA